MGGSTKGASSSTPGSNFIGGSYDQYTMDGMRNPYMDWSKQDAAENKMFDDYLNPAGLNYWGSPVGSSGLNSSMYDPSKYEYKVPEYAVDSNANVQGLIDSVTQDSVHQAGLMNRNLDQRAAAAGMSGGSRHGTQQAAGMDNINRGLMNTTSNIRYQANENQLARQQAQAESQRQLQMQQQQQAAAANQAQAQQDFMNQILAQNNDRSAEQEAYNRAQAQQDLGNPGGSQYYGETKSAAERIADNQANRGGFTPYENTWQPYVPPASLQAPAAPLPAPAPVAPEYVGNQPGVDTTLPPFAGPTPAPVNPNKGLLDYENDWDLYS